MSEELIQGSPEWFQARLGKVTASRVADVIARTKTGYGASRANYMAELLCERLTGKAAERFTNAAMQHGTDTEPEARTAYEFRYSVDVVQVGFVAHPKIADTGASPDGFVGSDGMLEIKCPNSATHIETLLSGNIPEKYMTQMMWQMVCSGRQWCDYVSYDPRLPGEMRLFVQRVNLPSIESDFLEAEVIKFLNELRAKESALRSKFGAPEPVPEIVQTMLAG